MILKYRLLVGVLVLALVASWGLGYYYYNSLQAQNVAFLNNMRSRAVNIWAMEMSLTGSLIEDATTNLDMDTACQSTESTYRIGDMIYEADYSSHLHDLTWQMFDTPWVMRERLFSYANGSPTYVKHINPSAFPMFKNLTSTIYKMTGLILDLDQQSGIDPAQQLTNKGVLDDIIRYCIDIKNISEQLADFNPKFQ